MSKLQAALEEGFTVAELIEQLRSMDPNSKVAFTYNYGDHWRTTVAPIVTTVDEAEIKWSDYHDMPSLVDEDRRNDNEETANVVVFNLN